MNRHLKQLIYGSVYLAILALFGFWIYFSNFHTTSTCFDNIQNQDEEGIDCGGACFKICLPNEFGTIEVVDRVRILKVDDEHLSLLVKIQNNSIDFAAESFNYAINIFDSSDKLLTSIFGTSFIYQGEVKYLAVPNAKISPSLAARATFESSNPNWILGETLAKPDVIIQNQKTIFDNTQIKVEGSLISHSVSTLSNIKIIAIFYSQFGLPVGVSQTEIENLEPNGTRLFVINHRALEDILTDKTQVFVFAKR